MAKDLPYFKFFCSEWTDGDITLENYKTQGLFINICSYYWSNNCDVTYEKLNKKFKNSKQDIKILILNGLLKEDKLDIVINFLDEQLIERQATSKQNSKNGAKGGRPKKSENKPNALIPLSESKGNKKREEEKREEEKREYEIPTYEVFKSFALEKAERINMKLDLQRLELKYESWKENGWKDGNDNKIKSWKTKLLNTISYLKSDKKSSKPTDNLIF